MEILQTFILAIISIITGAASEYYWGWFDAIIKKL
jgi:ABC-type dipeptide/oligopeptide/nickel transport system permease subunit